MESMRGFDVFLQVADRVCALRSDVTVLVIGEDRIAYGGDVRFTQGKTFKQWTLDQRPADRSRIHFVGRLPPRQLVSALSLSDAHVYWTVPFTLSWSLFNAMSCHAMVLGSDTAPVRELISDGQDGMLVDFFDVDAWVDRILMVLNDPAATIPFRQAARQKIVDNYSLSKSLKAMLELYDHVAR